MLRIQHAILNVPYNKILENCKVYYKILEESYKENLPYFGDELKKIISYDSPQNIMNSALYGGSYYIAFDGNKPIGTVELSFGLNEMHIGHFRNFTILKESREKGYETALLDFIEYVIYTKAQQFIKNELEGNPKVRNRMFYNTIKEGNAIPTASTVIWSGLDDEIEFFLRRGYIKNSTENNRVFLSKILVDKKESTDYVFDKSPLILGNEKVIEPPKVNRRNLGINDSVRLDPFDLDDQLSFIGIELINNEYFNKSKIHLQELLDKRTFICFLEDNSNYLYGVLKWFKKNELLFYLGLRNGFIMWSIKKNEDLLIKFDLSKENNSMKDILDEIIRSLSSTNIQVNDSDILEHKDGSYKNKCFKEIKDNMEKQDG